MPDPNAPEFVINSQKFRNNSLVYPSDLSSDTSMNHFIMFFAYSRGDAEFLSFENEIPSFSQTQKSQNNPNNFRFVRRTEGQGLGNISLYFPNNLQTQYNFDYGDAETRMVGAIADAQSVGQLATDVGGSIVQRLLSGVEFITGVDEGAIQKVFTNRVRNPRMEVVFRTPQFRTHQFEFDFYPRNKQESYAVKNIIKKFKKHAHPKFEEGKNSLFIYPDEFEIILVSSVSDKDWLFKINRSYLTAINVNYTPMGKSTFFKDTGAPVGINLSLTFKETTILSEDDIEDGY